MHVVQSTTVRFFSRGVIRIIPSPHTPSDLRVEVSIDDLLANDLVRARAAALGFSEATSATFTRVVRGPEPTSVEAADSEIVIIDHVDAEALAHCGRRTVVAVLSLQAPAPLLDLALGAPTRDAGLIVDPVLAERLAGRDARHNIGATREALTGRQLEILRELAAGRSMKQIASVLGITTKTVENQATRIYATLGAANRHEAVQQARQLQLLESPA